MVMGISSASAAAPAGIGAGQCLISKMQILALPIFAMYAFSGLPTAEAKISDVDCHKLCHEVHRGFLRAVCISLCLAGKFAAHALKI